MDSHDDIKRFWYPEQSKCERAFYILVIVFCICAMTYNLGNLAKFYLNDPVASQITIHHVNEMDLPELGVCLPWPLNISMLEQSGFTQGDVSQLHWHFTTDVQAQIGLPKFWENTGPSNFSSQNQSYENILSKYAALQPEFFKQCTANYEQFDCKQKMQPVMHEKFGRCYKFKTVNGKVAGAFAGYVIFMAIPKSVFSHRNLLRLPQTEGIVLELAHKYDPPRTQQTREQILLTPNEESYVALQVTRLERDATPTRPCQEGSITEYSKAACRLLFHNQGVENYCNCTLLGFSDNHNDKLCDPAHLSACTRVTKDQIKQEVDKNEQMYCVSPCHQIVYTKTVTRMPLLADQLAWSLNDSDNDNYYFKFHVFYPNLLYTLVAEFYVANFDTVLGDVGGVIGLYMGSSIIGIVAIIYACMSNIVRKAKRKVFAVTEDDVMM